MPRSRTPWPRLAPATIGLLASLTACASRTPTAATEPPPLTAAPSAPNPSAFACAAFGRISFSRLHDTGETIRQVKAYDAARDALCGTGK